MVVYLEFVLEESLKTVNILWDYHFRLVYEFTSLVLHFCNENQKKVSLKFEIWEKLIRKMMDHLLEDNSQFESILSQLFRQFLLLPDFPRDLPYLLKDRFRERLSDIHGMSLSACEVVLLSWSINLVKKPDVISKLLTIRNLKFFFRFLDQLKTTLQQKQENANRFSVHLTDQRQQGFLFFHIIQLLNKAICEMPNEDRVHFCCHHQFEFSKLVVFFELFFQQEEYVFELAMLICAVHLTVQEAQPLEKRSLLLDSLLGVPNFRIICNNLSQQNNAKKNGLYNFLRDTIDDYRTQTLSLEKPKTNVSN